MEHRGCANILHAACSHYGLDSEARFGMMTPYVFDISFYNIFCSLAVFGCTCVLLDMPTEAESAHITHLFGVPSVLSTIRMPTTVQHVEVGGEALTQAAVDAAPEGARIINYYGPVEVTQWATRQLVHDAHSARKLASIGQPLPNVTCYVVDPSSTISLLAPMLQPIRPVNAGGRPLRAGHFFALTSFRGGADAANRLDEAACLALSAASACTLASSSSRFLAASSSA